MAASKKPVIFILHGAWHRPMHYIRLVDPLRAMGFKVIVPALSTAGWNENVPDKAIPDDVQVVRQAMLPYLEAGDEIVMVCHSYGGFPGTDSVVGETVQDRSASGARGGVKSLIYIAAFAAPASGKGLFDALAFMGDGTPPDWWEMQGNQTVLNDKATKALYNGVDESLAAMAMASTVQHSAKSMHIPVEHTAKEVTAPKIYIATKQDQAIPYDGQILMAEAAGANVITFDCGHSPFLQETETAKLVDIVVQAAA